MRLRRWIQGPSDHIAVQAFRFIVVGLVAFALDFSLLMFAVQVCQWNYLFSAALAYTAGLTLNYMLCVGWVFPQRRFQDQGTEFVLFAIIGVTGLGLTEIILWTGKECLGLHIGLAKFLALAAVAVWNFFLRKFLLFSGVARSAGNGTGPAAAALSHQPLETSRESCPQTSA